MSQGSNQLTHVPLAIAILLVLRASVSAINLKHIWALAKPHESHAGMSLPSTADLRMQPSGIWLRQKSLRHILASPGYAPGTIAVNVIHGWKEDSMLVKRLVAYTHLSSTVSEIYQVIGRKLRHFHTPPLFSGPAGVTLSEFREDLDMHKTRMNGLS